MLYQTSFLISLFFTKINDHLNFQFQQFFLEQGVIFDLRHDYHFAMQILISNDASHHKSFKIHSWIALWVIGIVAYHFNNQWMSIQFEIYIKSLMVKSRVMMMGLPNGCHFNLLFMVSIKNSKSQCIWSGYLTPLLRWCHHRALIQSAFETKKVARQHQSAQKMGILSNCDLSQSQDKSWTQILVWPFRFWFIAFGILTSITFTRAAK